MDVDGEIITYLFQVDDSINDHVCCDASVIDIWENEAPRPMHEKHAITTMYTSCVCDVVLWIRKLFLTLVAGMVGWSSLCLWGSSGSSGGLWWHFE